ncbi:MAG: DUF4331 domain-containing protein, partial [Holophaga sp.]|nr:DUF4331 domain-containing protein [Holophaga sp.]
FAVSLALAAASVQAANHREAPITALDHKADITDVYAFRSYDGGPDPRVTLIMGVDPLLEPGNGPNWFPFDPDILYEIKVDNDYDAVEDIVFQFRFSTEQRLPGLFQVYAGISGGANAPYNAPDDLDGNPTVGTPVVPDKIDEFDDAGLGQRQSYTVTMIKMDKGGKHDDDEEGRKKKTVLGGGLSPALQQRIQMRAGNARPVSRSVMRTWLANPAGRMVPG